MSIVSTVQPDPWSTRVADPRGDLGPVEPAEDEVEARARADEVDVGGHLGRSRSPGRLPVAGDRLRTTTPARARPRDVDATRGADLDARRARRSPPPAARRPARSPSRPSRSTRGTGRRPRRSAPPEHDVGGAVRRRSRGRGQDVVRLEDAFGGPCAARARPRATGPAGCPASARSRTGIRLQATLEAAGRVAGERRARVEPAAVGVVAAALGDAVERPARPGAAPVVARDDDPAVARRLRALPRPVDRDVDRARRGRRGGPASRPHTTPTTTSRDHPPPSRRLTIVPLPYSVQATIGVPSGASAIVGGRPRRGRRSSVIGGESRARRSSRSGGGRPRRGPWRRSGGCRSTRSARVSDAPGPEVALQVRVPGDRCRRRCRPPDRRAVAASLTLVPGWTMVPVAGAVIVTDRGRSAPGPSAAAAFSIPPVPTTPARRRDRPGRAEDPVADLRDVQAGCADTSSAATPATCGRGHRRPVERTRSRRRARC